MQGGLNSCQCSKQGAMIELLTSLLIWHKGMRTCGAVIGVFSETCSPKRMRRWDPIRIMDVSSFDSTLAFLVCTCRVVVCWMWQSLWGLISNWAHARTTQRHYSIFYSRHSSRIESDLIQFQSDSRLQLFLKSISSLPLIDSNKREFWRISTQQDQNVVSHFCCHHCHRCNMFGVYTFKTKCGNGSS